MIKAIFFDIDGTLLSHTSKKISKSTEDAFVQLRKKGIKCFAATGRHLLEIQELPANHLPFDGYITLNGQICLDEHRELVYDAPINAEDVKRMLSVFSQKELPVMIVEQNRMYINYVNELVCEAQKAISTPVPDINTYTGNKIYQFIVYDDGGKMDAMMNQLKECKMIQWYPYAVDIISKSGGKIVGIQHYLQQLHIGRNEIMAFGDGENDIDMLRYAGVGVAMGNADSKVKSQADYVTESVDCDGVYKALQHFGLL